MSRVPAPVLCALDSLPEAPKPPCINDLLLPTGMFCVGVIGSVMIMILLWATPAILQTADSNAAPTIIVR
jgi:hypothetical protein